MENQIEIIKNFIKESKYYMVSYSTKKDNELGKILTNDELNKVNLNENEIHRSIENKNRNTLFVFDLKPKNEEYVDNQLELLLNNLYDARTIESIYPNIFQWVYNGLNIKAYAWVPSGEKLPQSTLSRYGGTINFIKVLKLHLTNMIKMRKGGTPDYNFLDIQDEVELSERAVGSINKNTNMFSIYINLEDDFRTIIKSSEECKNVPYKIRPLNLKYWAREINPDFIVEAKHIKLKNTIPISDDIFDIYPAPIKRLMAMHRKGNYYRFLLARFLLSIHTAKDAKFIFNSVLSNEEALHIKSGDCSTQWNYVLNNIKRYTCPSMKELKRFIRKEDEPLTHPLEKIQKLIEKENE